MLAVTIPTEKEKILYHAVKEELFKMTVPSLTDDDKEILAANFVANYDFGNTALYSKSPASWAEMIVSEIE